MSKRLIVVLALAFIFSTTFAAYAEVQNVKVSGDLILTGIMRADYNLKNNTPDADSGSCSSNWNADKQQYLLRQVRVRVDADLTDNVSTTVRLLNEGVWGDTNIQAGNENDDEVWLDLAYATLKEFLYSPLTLTLGRQEMLFGNGLIVGDPDTNLAAMGWSGPAGVLMSGTNWYYTPAPDISLRKAFDSIRATLDYDPLVIDGIYAKIDENNPAIDDDVTLFGINAAYDFRDAMRTIAEAYYFCKYTGRKANDTTTKSKVDRVNTIGTRVKTEPIKNLTTQAEVAFQFGTYDPATNPNDAATDPVVDREAWAMQLMASYNLTQFEKLNKYNPVVSMCYAFFSGEHDNRASGTKDTSDYHGWNPMFENQTFGRIHNALIEQTNQHILGLAGVMTPIEDVTLGMNYYAYWLHKEFAEQEATILNGLTNGYSYTMANHAFLGQEFDFSLIYDYTEDVQLGLMAGWFVPGKAFDADNSNTASELIGSMKVTF